MFGFLKKKIQEAASKFTKKAQATEVNEQELTPEEQEALLAEAQEAQAQESQDVVKQQLSQPPVQDRTASVKPVSPSSAKEKKPTLTSSSSEQQSSTSLDETPTSSPLPETFTEPEREEKTLRDQEDVAAELASDLATLPTLEEEQNTAPDGATKQIPLAEVGLEPAKNDASQTSPVQPADFTQPAVAVQQPEDKNESLVDEPVADHESTAEITEPAHKEEKRGFFGRLFGKKHHETQNFSPGDEHAISTVSADMESSTQPPDETHDGALGEPVLLDDEPLFDNAEASLATTSATLQLSREKAPPKLDTATAVDATQKKKGFFGKLREKVVKFKLTEEAFEELFWDFELALLENNVAVEVIEKLKTDLHQKLTQDNVSRRGIEDVIMQTLRDSIDEILSVETFNLIEQIRTKRPAKQPFVISVIGVNGSGKTTTIAKLVHLLQQQDLSVVLAASDTFRAAAIQQLEEHANRLDVKLIKHDYGADPSAVAYDAIKHATAKNIDVVLIDTAGRLQSNSNLMDELKKLIRVNKPDMKLFVGESITGNDCVEQAVAFNEAVGIDGIILSKADVDDKGGAAISVSYVTKKPILYLGTGQTYDDLQLFNKEKILENLFS